MRSSVLGGNQIGSSAEIAAVRNPKFSKDISVKPEFLPQLVYPLIESDLSNNISSLQPIHPSSSQTSKSTCTSTKVTHKKQSKTTKRFQRRNSSLNGVSRVEDASIKDILVRDSIHEVASLFSKPKLSTILLDSPISQQPNTLNASSFIATNELPIVSSNPTLKINNRIETAQVVSQDVSTPEVLNDSSSCLGGHIARRLVEIGIKDIFTVPGDFNLILLDHLIAHPGLNNIGCCNEINAGYAADGYARCRGVGACVVTFTVGGLSVINAIAGSYSENLPIICLVGGPNSNDFGSNRILHHTIGIPDFSQEARCFQEVTCYQVIFILLT